MPVYHVELRSFPKAATLFNQSGLQVGALVLPWVQDRIVELDGEKWAPWESTITILEGPAIPVEGLSMGRGWKTAQHEGADVTERILTEARAALADGSAQQPAADTALEAQETTQPAAVDYPSRAGESARPADPGVASAPADPPLGALLGPEAPRLLAAWQAVTSRASGLAPSETLALAERELRSQSDPPA
jgi:hypothetical protein